MPLRFQTIDGLSAISSGIMTLPIMLGVVCSSIITGLAISYVGYCNPFIISSSLCMSVGIGLLTTLTSDTSRPALVCFQILLGLGLGMGIQSPISAVQAVLAPEYAPIGVSIIMFARTLGGAIAVSISQNVFANRLSSALISTVPNLDPAAVLATGATTIEDIVGTEYTAEEVSALQSALARVFMLPSAQVVFQRLEQ
jgi:hypothetical protein